MKTIVVRPARKVTLATRCTSIDAQLRWLVPRCGYSFEARLEPQRLARALSRVLPDYHVFAGRIIDRASGGLEVRPSDDGVPLEVVDSARSLAALSEAENASGRGRVLTPGITARRALSGKGPLFAARLTRAADGSALGFAWHHPIADYSSVHLLMRAWGQAYRDLPHEPGFDVEDRGAYFANHVEDSPGAQSGMRMMRPLDAFRLAASLYPPQRRVMFELSGEDLASIHATHATVSGERRASVEDAMWAQIFLTVLSLRGLDQATLVWIVDMRRRLGLPANLIGNATAPLSQLAGVRDGASKIAAEMRAQVRELEARHVNYHATCRFIDAHSGVWERNLLAAVTVDPARPVFMASSLAGFKHEEIMFEPGAPAAGFYVTPSDGGFWNAVSFAPPEPASGDRRRVVSLWLPRQLARAFERHQGRALVSSAGLSARTAEPSARTAPGQSLEHFNSGN